MHSTSFTAKWKVFFLNETWKYIQCWKIFQFYINVFASLVWPKLLAHKRHWKLVGNWFFQPTYCSVLPVHKWPKCLPAHVSTKVTFTHNASPWANNATGIRTPGLMKQLPDPSGPLKCPSTGQIYCSYETLRESCWPACKHSDFNKVKCNVSEKRVIFTPRRNPLQLVANVLIALKVLLSCVNN